MSIHNISKRKAKSRENIKLISSLLSLFLVGIMLSGCQSSEDVSSNQGNTLVSNENGIARTVPANDESNKAVKNDDPANTANTETLAVNSANSNIKPQIIDEVPPRPEGGPTPISLTEAKKKRLEQFRNADGTGLPPGVPENADPQVKPAPDNSEYFISLTDVARETRRFKSHSILDKVEKESDGKNVRITAFLKDGRKARIEPKRITNFPNATAAEFLSAAGIKQ